MSITDRVRLLIQSRYAFLRGCQAQSDSSVEKNYYHKYYGASEHNDVNCNTWNAHLLEI